MQIFYLLHDRHQLLNYTLWVSMSIKRIWTKGSFCKITPHDWVTIKQGGELNWKSLGWCLGDDGSYGGGSCAWSFSKPTHQGPGDLPGHGHIVENHLWLHNIVGVPQSSRSASPFKFSFSIFTTATTQNGSSGRQQVFSPASVQI